MTANHRYYIEGDTPEEVDERTEEKLYEMIDLSPTVDVIATVFDGQDNVGHQYGPHSLEYAEYIQNVQRPRISRIMQKLRNQSHLTNDVWIVVLTSDHGSHMYSAEPSCIRGGATGGRHTCFHGDRIIPMFMAVINQGSKEISPDLYKWLKTRPLQNHKECYEIAMKVILDT